MDIRETYYARMASLIEEIRCSLTMLSESSDRDEMLRLLEELEGSMERGA